MKQTTDFGSMFNNVLEETRLSDGRTGGVSNWKHQNRTKSTPTSRGQNHPFSLSTTSGYANSDSYIEQPEQTDAETQAPKRYPYPMDSIEPLFRAGEESLHGLLSMIKQSIDHPSVTAETKKELQLIRNQLEKTIEFLQKVERRVVEITI